MRFSSSKWVAGFATLIALTSCSPKNAPDTRLPFPKIGSIPQASLPPAQRGGAWLLDLYNPSEGMSACDWLNSASRQDTALEARFQMVGKVTVAIQEAAPSKKPSKTGSRYLMNVTGMVDSAGSPLYSYALLSQSIPSRKEFMALVKQEIAKTTGIPFKLLLGQWLMRVGILNPYTQRNKIIEQRINEALPGIFAPSEDQPFKIRTKDSIPWIILKNGATEIDDSSFADAKTYGNDLQGAREEQKRYQKVLENFGKTMPIFSGATWRSLSDDTRLGLSTALRAFKTRDPEEKTCATTILHRTLSQLFMIIGYDRLPFEIRQNGDAFHLPGLDTLLESKKGTRFMVCPTAGSFVRDGRRVIVDRDVLTAFKPGSDLFDLSAGPQPLRICERRDAVPYGFDLHRDFAGDAVAKLAQGSDWLALIDSLVNFLTAFNPGAPWWMDPSNTIGFPMAPFESLDRIKTSGAILPVDANALSLGLLNLSIASFLKKHLLFLDEQNRIVTDVADASKIRISEKPHTGDPADSLIQTPLESAVLLAETSFKLGETLKSLAAWKTGADAQVKDDMAHEPDLRKRMALMQDYRNFVEGMYGSVETLGDLTTPDKGGMREQIESLKLASALLIAEFARKDGSGRYDCVARLDLDLATGQEQKRGSCSEEDKHLWKYALGLIAQEYRSPHYAALAQ